jgi:hypothetical protein
MEWLAITALVVLAGFFLIPRLRRAARPRRRRTPHNYIPPCIEK